MKQKRIIFSVIIIVIILAIIIFRLISNKQSFDEQLQMVSNFNSIIPVMTDTVKYEKIKSGFSVNGNFQPLHEISINSENQGKATSVSVTKGDKVKAGQVLATLDNELYKSQLDLAKFNLEKAEKDMLRFEKLLKGDASTIQEYESAKQVYENARSAYTTAKIQYENTFLKAPSDGIITKKYIEKGSFLTSGGLAFDMAVINKVKFIAKLRSEELEKVHKGEIVNVCVDDYPGIIYNGVVNEVAVNSDNSKRYDVEVEVINQNENIIKPGMFGVASFEGNAIQEVLVIPRQAVIGSILNPEVFIVNGDSVDLKSVVVTPLNDKYVVVKSHLNKGDVVVVSGQINLINGSKIKLNK